MKLNRFQTASMVCILIAVLLVATLLSVDGPTALAIVRAVGLMLTTTVVLGYGSFLDPRPFFTKEVDAAHLLGAGVVFICLAIDVSLIRATFFDAVCRQEVGSCYNVVLAGQIFGYLVAFLNLIAGPLLYRQPTVAEMARVPLRWFQLSLTRWFAIALVIGSFLGGWALISGLQAAT